MTRIDRRALFTSGAAAALLAATGASAQTTPRRGGRLRAALSGADRNDHWGVSDSIFMQAARGSVFETLTEIAGDGTLRGDIAQSWETDDRGKSWVFNLHSAICFHDGIPLQPTDIISLFQRHFELNALHVTALSKFQIKVILKEPNHSLPYLLADPKFAVLPTQIERQAAGIGTGLYRVEKFQAGRQFIGTRVQAHRKAGTAGWFDQVELVSFSSEAIRAEALRMAMVDVADITTLDAYSDSVEYQLLPSSQNTQQISRHTIGVPSAMGHSWALDNTRMAIRWWIA